MCTQSDDVIADGEESRSVRGQRILGRPVTHLLLAISIAHFPGHAIEGSHSAPLNGKNLKIIFFL